METLETPQPPRQPLPIISRPLDNTALDAYMTCPKKFEYSMVQHRRHRGKLSPALTYGTTWHVLMEMYYKGLSESEILQAAVLSWEHHGNPDDHRTLDRCIAAFQEFKKTIPDDRSATLGWPSDPQVELSIDATWDGALHPYAGKIDRILVINDQLYVEDHKTTSQLGSYYFQNFQNDNQMLGYAYLCRVISGRWPAGVRINAHGILKRENKFQRETLSFSKERLEDWAANYNRWVVRIEQSYASSDFPRNMRACVGKYGACAYLPVCSVSPRIRQRVLESQYELDPWNPLAVKETGDGHE